VIPSETRERFIHDVTVQIPSAGIIEAHFFAPRRVGGVESGVAVIAASLDAPPDAPERYTVFSATYRHTVKGVERGKWEVTVKAEADAPLITVDQVVRGVQRRAEDTEEVERMTGDEIRALAAAPDPAAAP
jgi:hypothetical protein